MSLVNSRPPILGKLLLVPSGLFSCFMKESTQALPSSGEKVRTKQWTSSQACLSLEEAGDTPVNVLGAVYLHPYTGGGAKRGSEHRLR